jgi:ATP-dependent protease ClpP protease subunit
MKNKPIRCFDGNAQPYQPFWTFRNAAQTDSGETEIELYGPISEFSWWGDEITPKMFKDQLYANGKAGPVTVRLNSPGGDLIAASVTSAILKDYPGKVTIKVDGLAASAAVMVALAGDRVLIQSSAYMMIHNPMVGIMGYYGVDDLKSLIDELKVIKNGIVEGYTAKTKMDAEKLSRLMNDETWMTASESVAYGFADEVITTGASKSAAANYVNVLQSYMNVPRALLQESSPAQPDAVNEERAQHDLQSKSKKLAAHAKLFLTKE